MRVYFDNAASTPLAPEVLESMMPFLTGNFGNPSSVHAFGREARSAIEKSRKKIADLIGASPSEIFFTSSGTEADNLAIFSSIRSMEIQHAISSSIEHHAVLHVLEELEKRGKIFLSFVDLDEKGHPEEEHLAELLRSHPGSFVSLMHANNELGNLNNIERIGALNREFNAVFHSDTVQTMGHFPLDVATNPIDFITASAHKFHGPKGTGFLYIKGTRKIAPLLFGGAQERNMRGGTENVAGIVGMAKALELAISRMEDDRKYIEDLKFGLAKALKEEIPGTCFNGDTLNPEKSLYTVLSASLPESEDNEMLLFNLDIAGIAVSGGSACSSGSLLGSHVLRALDVNPRRGHVRFSFSRFNTRQEVDYTVQELKRIFLKE